VVSIRSVVILPAPLGPRKPTSSPGATSMSTPQTASWPDHLLTLAEWDALPQDTSRCYELVEGVLLVVPRPPLHQRAMWRLCSKIEDELPG